MLRTLLNRYHPAACGIAACGLLFSLTPVLRAQQPLSVYTKSSLPINVLSGQYQVASGRAIVDLTLAPGESTVEAAGILLVHIRQGKVLGGQEFNVAVRNPSQENGEEFTPFFHMISGDRIGALVTEADTSKGTLSMPPSRVAMHVKALAQGEQTSFRSGRGDGGHSHAATLRPAALNFTVNPAADLLFQSAGINAPPPHPSCYNDLQDAEQACPNGVQSFSCNPQTGQWSFTCAG
jgi:hypothetical protein